MRDLLEEHFSNEGLNAIKEAQATITAKGGVVCVCLIIIHYVFNEYTLRLVLYGLTLRMHVSLTRTCGEGEGGGYVYKCYIMLCTWVCRGSVC